MKSRKEIINWINMILKNSKPNVEDKNYFNAIKEYLSKDRNYYIAYFKINNDGDFYFRNYKDLNYTSRLFDSIEEAFDTIKHHLKYTIDTFENPENRDLSYVKNAMENAYDELLGGLYSDEVETGSFEINKELGNYEIYYSIKRIKFFKEDISNGKESEKEE